jgi:hypothetical protein
MRLLFLRDRLAKPAIRLWQLLAPFLRMTFRQQLGSPQSLFERYPVAKRRGVPPFGEPIPETFLDCGRASWAITGQNTRVIEWRGTAEGSCGRRCSP